ncbi:LamG domain-containing protein [Candidatus Pacearchaeota archaeon]|nr:LamG domain-containing protein [Candidatus Pacearchaeota archaeon]
MKRGEKKGLSTVITTLIIIGLSLAAIIIIWVVIRNIVETGSQQVELGKYTVDMKIQKVGESLSGTNVTIKRNAGQGQVTGVKIIISDGISETSFDQKMPIEELETKTFSVNYTGIVKTVSVAPIIKSGDKESTEDIASTLKLSGYDSAKNLPGLVSWWRMEGNANDEMGRNDGALVGNPQLVDGKYGKAYNFSGTGSDYINLPDNPSLRLEGSNTSILLWFKLNNDATGQIPLFFKGGSGCSDSGSSPGYCLGLEEGISNFRINARTNGFGLTTNEIIQKNVWSNIASTTNLTSLPGTITWRAYLNGNLNKTYSRINVPNFNSTGVIPQIGSDDNFHAMYGIIDELMIFNRTLSDQEIQVLYSLDLSN